MIQIAVCDDEQSARAQIINLLSKSKYCREVNILEISSGSNLVNLYSRGLSFNIIFLDVEMDEINGLEVAKKIRYYDPDVIIIFISSHGEYVFSTFEFNTFHYLLKPIEQEVFEQVLDRAICQYKINHFNFKIETGTESVIINVGEILYLEVVGRSIILYTVLGRYQYKGKLKDEEIRLTPYNFIRTHKSYLVNMKHIKIIGKTEVSLDRIKIPLSKNMRANVLSSFNQYLSRSLI